jgi:hypothetical protein
MNNFNLFNLIPTVFFDIIARVFPGFFLLILFDISIPNYLQIPHLFTFNNSTHFSFLNSIPLAYSVGFLTQQITLEFQRNKNLEENNYQTKVFTEDIYVFLENKPDVFLNLLKLEAEKSGSETLIGGAFLLLGLNFLLLAFNQESSLECQRRFLIFMILVIILITSCFLKSNVEYLSKKIYQRFLEPFYFSDGSSALNLNQFIELCKKFENESEQYLMNRDFENWLEYFGEKKLAKEIKKIRLDEQNIDKFKKFINIVEEAI